MTELEVKNKFRARLHVLMARKSKTAVVLRRGPSGVVGAFGWDRQTDKFTLGQWLAGRIYERRSDLSPNGKYLIYFAMNMRRPRAYKAWTAISRAPFLKAIGLWSKGNTYHGGGLFVSDKQFWRNDGYGHDSVLETKELELDSEFSPECPIRNYECLGVYYPKLIRDGWQFKGSRRESSEARFEVFEKSTGNIWVLRKLAQASSSLRGKQGRGVYFDTHELVNSKTNEITELPTWEWAEVDEDRIVWAEGGKLFAAQLSRRGLFGKKELQDFNGCEFEAVEAPY